MKVAGGLLLGIGAILALATVMYQNDTGKTDGLTLILGVVIVVIGIILINTKSKKE